MFTCRNVCLFVSCLVITFIGLAASPYSRLRQHASGARNYKVYGQDCGSDELTCVLREDCKYQCPPRFTDSINNAACYYIFNETLNMNRTMADSQDFCSRIADHLLWLEDSQEVEEIIRMYGGEPFNVTLNALFSRDHRAWIWQNNHEKVEWKLLFKDLHSYEEIEDIIDSATSNECFAIDLMAKKLVSVKCNSRNGYICKLGEAKGSCARTGQTSCCYTPTFTYYVKNKDLAHDSGLQLGADGCRFKINNTRLKCDEVLDALEANTNGTVTRVGTSYFYFTNTTCIGRDAVISSPSVHKYIVRVMSTQENLFMTQPVKIGLTYNLREREGHWSNGKSEDHYETFWLPGEPVRDEKLDGGCAAYSKIPGSSSFRWRLFASDVCQNLTRVCELPVFRSPALKHSKSEECGRRKERGILAKTFYSTYDTKEAAFGEFPWQVSISFYESRGSGAKKFFACSGALVHRKFVLTSAHCVSSIRHSKIQVTLGEHDLKDDETILEPIDFTVEEIIIHPGYGEYHTYHNDIALLQLEKDVDVLQYPHVSLACLPDPYLIKSHNGRWDCYSVGWPDKGYGYRRVLERVPVEFTSEGVCHRHNTEYYRKLSYGLQSPRRQKGYNNLHSRRNSIPDLLCTSPAEDYSCSGDDSAMLICKKESIFIDKPFFNTDDSSHRGQYRSSGKPLYEHNVKLNQKDYREVDYIVNSYGGDRFDSDKWYIVGVGHGLSECGKDDARYNSRYYSYSKQDQFLEVWTSVYEYLEFVHHVIDLYNN